jgi:hypothetical protein
VVVVVVVSTHARIHLVYAQGSVTWDHSLPLSYFGQPDKRSDKNGDGGKEVNSNWWR